MNIKKIEYPTPLSEIKDIYNDNVDIFIELNDGCRITMVVITPQNISNLIHQSGKCFFEPGPPMIIVAKLTEDCIYSAIEEYCRDEAYWLKEYYLSGYFDIRLLNRMIQNLNNKK